nr:hypothetical protein [Actinomycetota bacterium]
MTPPKPSQSVTRTKVRCAGCGTKFVQSRRDNRYCSGACRQRAHRARGGVSDIDRRLDEAKALYWDLIREKVEATGRTESQVLTDEAQWVIDSNVYVRGELVGQAQPFRPNWDTWGLEAAPAPFAPPTDFATQREEERGWLVVIDMDEEMEYPDA